MKPWITHASLLLVLVASAGCTTFRMPFADSPEGHPMESTEAHAVASPPPAIPSRAPQAAVPPPRQLGENNMSRGTAIPPHAAVKIAPLPPPPVTRSSQEDFLDHDRPTAEATAERAAVAGRLFALTAPNALHAQAAELVSVEPVQRPPSKAIPYWTRPENNTVTHQEANGAADPDGLPGDKSAALISWPSPVTLPRAVQEMWDLYRRFEFGRVLESATEFVSRESSRGYPLATATMLAAASAYLAGDMRLARSFVVRSITACPSARPDPMVFPKGFCAVYQGIVMGMEESRKSTNSD